MSSSASVAVSQMFQKIEGKLRNDADALAVAIHACLDGEGFRLVAVGEEMQMSGKELEKLPCDWNQADDVYTFSYRHKSSAAIYLFKLLVVDDVLILHGVSDKVDDMHMLECR